MPPKRSISKKRASTKKLSQQTIPIFVTEILSSKQIRQPMVDILPQIQRQLKDNPQQLKMSFLNMLVRVCGLQEYSSDIQCGENNNSLEMLEEILEKVYEIKKTEISPLILDTRNKFHKDFIKRVREFLSAIISQQLGVFTSQEVQFNQSFLGWLQILTKSKLRTIRNASINFAKLIVQEQIKLYEQYHQKKQSKKAFTLAKSVSYYLQKIFSQRLKDVDHSIRELAFGVTTVILQQLQGDIITDALLNKLYSPLLSQDVVILQPSLRSLMTILSRCKENKSLLQFIKQHLPKLIEISKQTKLMGTNVLALKIIQSMHHISPQLRILNRDYLVSVLQSFAMGTALYGLHAVVEVFYTSLYKTGEQLQANSPIVLLQIINLLLGITNTRSLHTILTSFFTSTHNKKLQSYKIFSIDNMFNLLLSEKYRNQKNQDVNLMEKEISILLTIVSEYVGYCQVQYKHAIKDKLLYQKILQTYNNHLLMNCKQLFFQKMTTHVSIPQKYLNLFAHIHTPTLNYSGLENYLDFVCQKLQKLFVQQIQHKQLYKQIANVFYNLSKDDKLSQKYSAKQLINKLGLQKMIQQKHQLTATQIYRCSSLLSKFPIQQLLTSDEYLSNLIQQFSHTTNNEKQRMQILVILHFDHHYNFMQLLHGNGDQKQQQIYKNVRGKVLKLYLQVLQNHQQKISIRLCAFRNLTYMLRTISHKRFQQTQSSRVNAYQLTHQQMRIVYDYVTQQLFNSDSLDYSSLDITRMLQRMSIESHQIKSEVIKLLFGLYQQSFVFTCHSQSARFIISLIRVERQLHKQSMNMSHILPLSLDLTKQLQKKLNSLLQTYLNQQIKQSNLNKLIYWRLAYQIFTQSRQDQRFQIIMDKILSTYFSKKRKLHPQEKKRLTNKLMIFILHAVDKILQRKEYIHLDVYENILRKIYRKFDKQVLIRIKEFFLQKTQGIDSSFVNTFLETLQIISKVGVKKSKKKQQESDNSQSGEENNSQQQQDPRMRQRVIEIQEENVKQKNNNKGTKQKGRKSRSKKVSQQSRMVEIEEVEQEENVVEKKRDTRSQTKRKVK